jgi:hypothetical protein
LEDSEEPDLTHSDGYSGGDVLYDDVLFPKDSTSLNVVFPIGNYILHMLIVCVKPLNKSAFVGCRKHISGLKGII